MKKNRGVNSTRLKNKKLKNETHFKKIDFVFRDFQTDLFAGKQKDFHERSVYSLIKLANQSKCIFKKPSTIGVFVKNMK